jgi:hypothetical protein
VSSHPGENGRWEPKKASKQPCAREQPERTGKKFLQTGGAGRESQKITIKVHAGRGLETKWEMSIYSNGTAFVFPQVAITK